MYIFASYTLNIKSMEEDFNFEAFAVNVDADCVQNDFDEYDLFGERMIEDDNSETDIKFD